MKRLSLIDAIAPAGLTGGPMLMFMAMAAHHHLAMPWAMLGLVGAVILGIGLGGIYKAINDLKRG